MEVTWNMYERILSDGSSVWDVVGETKEARIVFDAVSYEDALKLHHCLDTGYWMNGARIELN